MDTVSSRDVKRKLVREDRKSSVLNTTMALNLHVKCVKQYLFHTFKARFVSID